MMSLLSELYQEVILDHNRQPRNFREIADPSGKAEGYNPLCGDKVTVFVKLEGERIKEISFKGTGCAISTASASLMTEALQGKTVSEAKKIFSKFQEMVTGKSDGEISEDDMDKLVVFNRLSEYPIRVKCATLVWHAFLAALEEQSKTVSTE
jgi:nitrogen fixation NifU-like protein